MLKMIQDKLLFSTDSSVIEKKCLCCKQFSHRFSFCPKLHFIADKEKIIKNDVFLSRIYKRTPFFRRTKKLNGLKHFLSNNFAAKKKSFIVLNILPQPPPESSNYLDSSEEIEAQDMEDKKRIKDESNLSSLMNSKQEVEEELNKITSHTEKSFHSHQTHEEEISAFQEKITEDKPDNNPVPKPKFDILFYFFDKVHNYKNYFPDFNIETIVKNQNRKKRIFRECNRDDGIFEKYKYLQSYSFYSNPFLETLLKEMKLRTKHHKSKITIASLFPNEIINEGAQNNGLDSKQNNLISPLRKTYFDIPKNMGSKKSIQELITLIKRKEARKRKTKT